MAQLKPGVRLFIALYTAFGSYLLGVGALFVIRLLSGGGTDYLFVSPIAIAFGLFMGVYTFMRVERKDPGQNE